MAAPFHERAIRDARQIAVVRRGIGADPFDFLFITRTETPALSVMPVVDGEFAIITAISSIAN